MKKFSFFVIALLVSATTIAKTTLPFIVSDKDASGKYGYVQDGKEIIPHIFDKAGAFYEGSVLSYAVFEKEYYIIDRNGNIVDENNPNRSYPPETYRHYAIIDRGATGIDIDASAGIVIDVNGKRLFPNHYAYPITVTAPNGKNYHLFGISKDRKFNNSQLANIKGEVIAKNLRGRFVSFGNGLIKYKEQSSGKEGLLNCYGQFLVPCQYEEVCFYSLYRLNYKEVKALKKAGVWGKYTEYQLKTLGIIYARNGKYITLYDQCGIQLTSPKKFKSLYYADIIKKYLKKVIIPHFSRKGAILHELKQKVINPNIARYDEYKAVVTTLPIYSSNKTNIVSYIKKLEANPKVEKYSIAECYNRGKAYYDKNKYTEAIPWLLRAAEGKYRPAYRKLADSYNNANQPEQAWNWYGSCVGGDGCDFSGNDYWYACMMLGNMFKVGRGCEKNLDSALHFLRAKGIISAIYIIAERMLSAEKFQSFDANAVYSILISCGVQYLIAFPIFWLMLLGTRTAKAKEKEKLTGSELIILFAIGQVLMYAGNLIGNLLNGIVGNLTGSLPENGIQTLVNETPIWLIFICVVILAPIVEELIFRKLMIDRLSVYGDKAAIIFSSIAFGLMHGNLYQFFYAALLGALFGYVYTKTHDVKYTILMHTLVNFLGSIVALPAQKAILELYEILEFAALGQPINILALIVSGTIVFVYSNLEYGLLIGGVFALVNYIKAKKFHLSPDKEIYLPDEEITKNGVLNAGAITFLIITSLLIILNLFAA